GFDTPGAVVIYLRQVLTFAAAALYTAFNDSVYKMGDYSSFANGSIATYCISLFSACQHLFDFHA
ncbi:MAG: hypothetical protein LBK23_03405, partial [Oscillospiraceae bacterium]|nr:hypothetical protein [Oscillospiraceae bacterium]